MAWAVWTITECKIENQKIDMQSKIKKMVTFSVVFAVIALGQQVAFSAEANEPVNRTFTADQARSLQENIVEGSFSGIGIEMGIHKDGLLIKHVLNGGGAEKAGLKAGEVITSIGSRQTAGMSPEEAANLIKGPAGTKVNFTIKDTEGKNREVSVERGTFLYSGIECKEVNDGIWLIRISAVNKKTPAAFRTEIEKLEKRNAGGLILDTRFDKGGYYDAVVEIASMFVPKGRIMWFYKPNNGAMEEVRADANQAVMMPTAVLVGKNTEVCELIAASLKNNHRAKLIGEKTSGLSAKRYIVKNDDATSKTAVLGTFFSSPEASITGQGVEPDIKLDENLNDEEIIKKAVETLKQETADKKQKSEKL